MISTMRSTMVVLGGALAAWIPTVAMAGDARHEHTIPDRNDDAATRSVSWKRSGSWTVSPPEQPASGGTRVAALFTVRGDRKVILEARGLPATSAGLCTQGEGAGPWMEMEQTFTHEEIRIAVVDLGNELSCAQLRMRASDDPHVDDLHWELLVPRYPDVGKRSRELAARGVGPVTSIGPELQHIGVVTREQWGARPTGCSAIESNWYRMAIHHTAGPQTAGGTVEGRVKATQAYAMDSGNYCDISYQMMVGFDGSLWEGRGLVFQSGATGGGNNGGNLAVSFIGCYHAPDSDCVGGVGHAPTDEMMQRGQLLVQTLVRLFDISTAEDNIRGHRDWPGNSTACPGSLLHPRLGELRADLAWFSASESDRSWGDETLDVPVGQPQDLWIELQNTGGLPWEPGETFLAPTSPRDQASLLHDPSWPTPIRAATVASSVPPGAVGRFSFRVQSSTDEAIVQTFGLVHESVTWFADPPWGGGPADDVAIVSVFGVSGETPPNVPDDTDGTGDTGDTGTYHDSEGFDTDGGLPSGYGDDDSRGCSIAPVTSAWMLFVLPVVWRRRAAAVD
jgi:hypothetical protein